MSKKTRKKTSVTSATQPAVRSTKTAAAKTARKAAAKAKAPAAAVGKPAAKKSGKTTEKPVKKTAKTAPPKAAPKAASSGLSAGDRAPAFTLPRDGGDSVSLKDYAGKKVVLFFYPRADTPGCTLEAIDFTRLKDDFAAAGTIVLGVSGDSLKAQESFRNKHKLATPLVSDEQHEMLEAYGAWGEKSMYGKTFLGIIRTTVLIGPDGKIVQIWRRVKVDGHAAEVLAVARAA